MSTWERQTTQTLAAIQAAISNLNRKVATLTDQNAEIAADVTDLNATATQINDGVARALAAIAALQAAVAAGQPVDPAELDALHQAVTSIGVAGQAVANIAPPA